MIPESKKPTNEAAGNLPDPLPASWFPSITSAQAQLYQFGTILKFTISEPEVRALSINQVGGLFYANVVEPLKKLLPAAKFEVEHESTLQSRIEAHWKIHNDASDPTYTNKGTFTAEVRFFAGDRATRRALQKIIGFKPTWLPTTIKLNPAKTAQNTQ